MYVHVMLLYLVKTNDSEIYAICIEYTTKLSSCSSFKQVEILLIELEEMFAVTVYAHSVPFLACTHAGSCRRHSSIHFQCMRSYILTDLIFLL